MKSRRVRRLPADVECAGESSCFDVLQSAVDTARRMLRAAGLDVGGIEYLDSSDGRRIFYDINANSNLRPSVAAASGFDPFERVVGFLVENLKATGGRQRAKP